MLIIMMVIRMLLLGARGIFLLRWCSPCARFPTCEPQHRPANVDTNEFDAEKYENEQLIKLDFFITFENNQ